MKPKKHSRPVHKKKSIIPKGLGVWIVAGILVLAIATAVYVYVQKGSLSVGPSESKNANASVIDLYVMSFCPYGTQAETGVIPAVKKLGADGKLNLYFIGNEQAGSFSSLHGQAEVDEDIRQLCALKQSSSKALDYILCVNEDISNVATKWKDCANQAGLDVSSMERCSTGDEGKSLLSESFKKSDEAGASASPCPLSSQ